VSSALGKATTISSAASKGRSLATLCWIVMRTGISTFGSGNTTSILLGRELNQRGWFNPSQFDLCFTIARAVPGTNLIAFIAAMGWYVRGWIGAAVSVAALSIPASIAVVLLTLGYEAFEAHPFGKHAINAAMAAIVGVMAAGSWLLAQPRIRYVRTAVLVLGGLLLSRYLPPTAVMAIGAVIGYFWREPS
jgi:chromate transporter